MAEKKAKAKSKSKSKLQRYLEQVDVKRFLIEKGERIILGVCVFFMSLALISSLIGSLRGGSASSNTAVLKQLTDTASHRMQSSSPPAELGALPGDVAKVDLVRVDSDWFPAGNPFFDPTSQDDRKWRQPKVLAPEDFAATVVRGAVPTYDLLTDEEGRVQAVGMLQSVSNQMSMRDIMMLGKNFSKYNKSVQQQILEAAMNPRAFGRGGIPGFPGGGLPGAGGSFGGGGPPGMGRGGAARGVGGWGGGGRGAWRDWANRRGGAMATELKFVPLNELDKTTGKPAQAILPMRMAIVSGAFPYKAQLEAWRRALHFDTIEQMMKDPQASPEFMGFDVQRREVNASGEIVADWADLDLEASIRRLRVAARGTEPEDPKMVQYGMIVRPNRLVMPRPKLIPHQNYPEVALAKLQEQMKKLEKAPAVVAPPPPRKTRFDEDTFDIFKDEESENLFAPGSQPTAQAPAAPAGGGPAPRRASRFGFGDEGGEGPAERSAHGGTAASAAPAKVVWPPDYCLLRFLDVTVQPGHSYEYRLRVRMANPNYKNTERAAMVTLTTEPLLRASDWTLVSRKAGAREVPLRVTVSDELLYYVLDDTATGSGRDEAGSLAPKPLWTNVNAIVVQAQRWLQEIQVDSGDKDSQAPVGDWAMLPQLFVHRGEYFGRVESVPVPIWDPTRDAFIVPRPPEPERANGLAARTRPKVGVPVDFVTDPITNQGSVVVDFEGGKRTVPGDPKSVLDDGPYEVLVWSANGTLIVHNSRQDSQNPERVARAQEEQQWLRTLEATGGRPGAGKGGDMLGSKDGSNGNDDRRGGGHGIGGRHKESLKGQAGKRR